MVLKIGGIKTIFYYNEEEGVLQLWLKMGNIEKKLGHSIIADPVLREIEDYYGKRVLYITEKEKQKRKSFLKAKKVFLLLRNLLIM